MSVLRFYWIDRAGHIPFSPVLIECADDADALAQATAMIEAQDEYQAIEIWDHARQVGKVFASESKKSDRDAPPRNRPGKDGIPA